MSRTDVVLVKNVPYAVRWCMSPIRWKGYKSSVEKFPESLGLGMENDSIKPKTITEIKQKQAREWYNSIEKRVFKKTGIFGDNRGMLFM